MTESSRHQFSLVQDLQRMGEMHHLGADAAVVFYAGRVLEVLSTRALERVGLDATGRLYERLNLLQACGLLSTERGYWAHALRRLGNDARHLLRATVPTDAALALVCTERLLDWFFTRWRFADETADALPQLPLAQETRAIVLALEDPQTDLHVLAADLFGPRAHLGFSTPVFAAVIGEKFIERDEHPAARRLLHAAWDRHLDDLRLPLLIGLSYSREGLLDEARTALEALYANRYFRRDTELLGILAGVYKRLWQRTPARGDLLRKAAALYHEGWAWNDANAYLGINAATTALLMGESARAHAIAGEVLQRLRAHWRRREYFAVDGAAGWGYWAQVTLAEAELLCGHWAPARNHFLAAFARHADRESAIASTRQQLALILRQWCATAGVEQVDAFLAGPLETVAPSPVIGVTGLSELPEDEALRQRISEALSELGAGASFAVLSMLGEGAERLVTEVALRRNGVAQAILPCEISAYLRRLSPASRNACVALLLHADQVIITAPPAASLSPRALAQAYRRCGIELARQSDALIAIWDECDPTGGAHTAEIVRAARRRGTPLAHIHPTPPYRLVVEHATIVADMDACEE